MNTRNKKKRSAVAKVIKRAEQSSQRTKEPVGLNAQPLDEEEEEDIEELNRRKRRTIESSTAITSSRPIIAPPPPPPKLTKSIKLSLQAKVKLGFLDGSCVKPTDDDGATQWMFVDAMVRSWILNTISKEIRANFEGTSTTQDQWQEVKSHYEGNNGPTLYGLARDISTINQGNLTTEEYYSKIRLYWEEIAGINPLPKCECDGSNIANCLGCREIKKFYLINENAKLLQFLLGLNESYENVKDQILNSDPFPPVHKAFAIVLNIEKKRELNILYHNSQAAMNVIETNESSEKVCSMINSKQAAMAKNKLLYKHCNMKGHLKEGCFKLVGYPDWWIKPKDKRRNTQQTHVHAQSVVHAPMDKEENSPSMEDFKLFKSYRKTMKHNSGHSASIPHNLDTKVLNYNMSLNDFENNKETLVWIIDYGASNHICHDKTRMTNLEIIKEPVKLFLPDGSIKTINHIGMVQIRPNLIIKQDTKEGVTIAIGKEINNLFLLYCNLIETSLLLNKGMLAKPYDSANNSSFQVSNSSIVCNNDGGIRRFETSILGETLPKNVDLLHARIGHPSEIVMKF
ncbi:uncharacterized protein LOC124934642 [Impatiens glandulifera]|uniref:uncharacterized protein LOC124934642 n=1 Tax=Impatiens glandulifera TaxID=253017 RepID=UPI001FB058E4|nr:uncharacterized protein LOC124934642 [Impatiens glandulifera]